MKRHIKRVKVMPRSASRRFVVRPDPDMPHTVEVRIARTISAMRGEFRRLDGNKDCDDSAGLCRSWQNKITGKPAVRPGMMVARIYLNAQSLSQRPSEIASHECAHAAMAWARHRGANLRHMAGEEVMCYALGRLVAQVNRVCYAARAFG